ncbi:hypothetical protein, variant [Aphanomyces invadans]|uniref:Deoxyribodipyrimidine photo-lyase n=1 Tax=Aphanomyces invadans TaxID=157072 RepID=A0A024TQS7_9STRA|nr:hypothetical protein, variant [Aphanomyces invadans]ETV96373.1 hypothetical protein, variant [Aphanomyces invadans]|eukprot:XP_008875165.1 hypothetical protein, variant [Aphanomyces invadans]
MRVRVADLARPGVHKERLRWLRGTESIDGTHVLYWMQSSLRTKFNYALEVAIDAATRLQQPLHVLHTIDAASTKSERHMAFLLESLVDVHTSLRTRNLRLNVGYGPSTVDIALAAAHGASLVVVDHPYLRHPAKLYQTFADQATSTAVLQVEGDVVVPVEHASDKEEHTARTIRPKITKLLDRYLKPLAPGTPPAAVCANVSLANSLAIPCCTWLDPSQSVDELLAATAGSLDTSVARVRTYLGGESQAQAAVQAFFKAKLAKYATARNEPSGDGSSNLSPYLHYGNVSPVDIALQTKAFAGTGPAVAASKASFLEELIVRRELSMNFVWYNPRYDAFDAALPAYAVLTLQEHAADKRAITYSKDELDMAKTHDPYWNAAQLDMVVTGKMQNYMRMYWGKKIIEWSATPQEAFATAIDLNDKYNLDGDDPNSYTGVAWVFGYVHLVCMASVVCGGRWDARQVAEGRHDPRAMPPPSRECDGVCMLWHTASAARMNSPRA